LILVTDYIRFDLRIGLTFCQTIDRTPTLINTGSLNRSSSISPKIENPDNESNPG